MLTNGQIQTAVHLRFLRPPLQSLKRLFQTRFQRTTDLTEMLDRQPRYHRAVHSPASLPMGCFAALRGCLRRRGVAGDHPVPLIQRFKLTNHEQPRTLAALAAPSINASAAAPAHHALIPRFFNVPLLNGRPGAFTDKSLPNCGNTLIDPSRHQQIGRSWYAIRGAARGRQVVEMHDFVLATQAFQPSTHCQTTHGT